MKKIKNTFDPEYEGEHFTIQDLAHGIRFGVLTWDMIPQEYHDEVQQYLNNMYSRQET